MIKPRTVMMSFELHKTRLTLSEIKWIVREAFENCMGTATGEIRQIQVNVIDATKPTTWPDRKKKSRRGGKR